MSTSDPRENGYQDEVEGQDPRISDDDPTSTEDYDYNCMEQGYSVNGHCPCCGGYTHTIGGNYDGEAQQETCEECEWKGAIDYD